MSRNPRPSSWPLTVLYAAGMAAVYVGERVVGAGKWRGILGALGIAMVLAAVVVRAVRMRKLPPDDTETRRAERTLLALSALGIVALALYCAGSDMLVAAGGKTLDKDWPKLATSVAALWPALMLASGLPLILVEIAYASMAPGRAIESGRIRDAMLTGLGTAGALVFAVSAVYVATARDHKWDLAYFRTARPGEATRKLVRSLDKELDVDIFFPPTSEVRDPVTQYFADLARESPHLKLASWDQSLDLAKARELGVSANGVVVLSRGGRREQISVGTELETARRILSTFDAEVQKRLNAVGRPGSRIVYITTGHGERTAEPAQTGDARGTIRLLRQALAEQGYQLKDLGPAEGLASDVPADAGAVMIVGPTADFLPEEAAALDRYFRRGGKLFVALDPEAGKDQKVLLDPLHVAFHPVDIADNVSFARRYHQASDKINLVTASYSSHPSVATLGRISARAPLILPGVGYFTDIKENKPKTLSTDFTVHSPSTSWDDQNGNFTFDKPPETEKAWDLAAALVRKKDGVKPGDKTTIADEGRAIVLGDSDCISDTAITAYGNPLLVIDGMKWLLGDEALAGETNSEADVPIAHTRDQDTWWFYSTIFLAPMLVVAAGLLATRRRRRGKGA